MSIKNLINGFKLKLWEYIYRPYYYKKYKDCSTQRSNFDILDSVSTVNYIIENKVSVSRFGDGELAMIYHYCDGGKTSNFYIQAFQNYHPALAEKLLDVLQNKRNLTNHKVAIPYPIKSVDEYKGIEKIFWERFVILDIDRFQKIIPMKPLYLNACFTRFYLNHSKRFNVEEYTNLLKRIWNKRNVCIIEGENSRLGVGNDLFSNTNDTKRILCPSINAFDKYGEILEAVKSNDSFDLYIIALGHTATVLAYDLSEMGLWALDLGHIDIEYEWFLRKAKKKIAIPNKYVNEIKEGRILNTCNDSSYQEQILVRIS